MISLRRSAVILAALLLGALAVGAGSAAAAGKKNCADEIIADWYGDGRVDGTYPQQCYEQAIKKLPADVQDYSSAKDDIENARRLALQSGTKSSTTPSDPSSTETTTSSPTTSKTTKTTTSPTSTAPSRSVDPGAGSASGSVDSSNASSVPVPLIILAGLALLLIAAGAVGYFKRRSEGNGGGPSDTPPSV